MSQTKSRSQIKGLLVVATSLLGAPVGASAATDPAVAPASGPIAQVGTGFQSSRAQLAQLDITINEEVCDRFTDPDCNPPGFQNREEKGASGIGASNFY